MGSVFVNATQRRIMTRREGVLQRTREGLSERQIAELYGVSRSTIWSDKQALKAEGRL